ncbi:SMP-30/gluconolactonase/LRE family protein [Polaribacter porphyrae]|uniref:Arylesterase n=1 Tax=Polaribacter porphyrae TaxID=1137780 RepID=A0A2S7WT76_9FLAO|nr:SMP-30/gluconolactonase/LRE family protein [Polaribacter porphyrae]PQJ80808.1 hypothetical protein BTO18_17235 [Polaribacter porphyrae]
MKFKKRFFYAVLILLLLFVANIFISTGYFRTIENKFEGEILQKIKIPGAEDITISRKDSFAIISSTVRNHLPNEKQEIGGLYLIDLKKDGFKPIHLTKDFKRPFAPHGISIFQKDGVTTIASISHTLEGEFIEFFTLINEKLTHQKTLKNDLIFSPNDIVLIDENRFYFTNDHKYKKGLGRLFEDYLGLPMSNVVYFDGENYIEVADGIAYANGINFDTNRNLLFVASPRKFLIKVYKKNEDGTLDFIEDIDCGTGVDNIELDENNQLWIGAHPNLLHFASYAKGKKQYSPSEIIKIQYKNKGDYSIQQVYMEDGSEMSGSTVAAPFNDLIFTGNVMDNHFLILKKRN